MIRTLLFFSAATLTLLLTGCYLCEEMILTIYPQKNKGVMEVRHIFSDSGEDGEEAIIKDFREMLKEYEGDAGIDPGNTITSRKLYEKGGRLHAKVAFTYTDIRSADILLSSDSSRYLVKQDGEIYDANGTLLQTDTGTFYSWPVAAKEIMIHVKLGETGKTPKDVKGYKNLLPYWKLWKKGKLGGSEEGTENGE